MVHYLQLADVLLINEMSIEQHGGNFVPPHNFLHEEALHYLLESVSSEMFGQPLYPTITDKAAVYMFNVISNHIFQDGNKRTGLEAALLFLTLNGYKLMSEDGSSNIKSNELFDFTIAVASGKRDLESVRAWFAVHAVPR